MNQIQRIQSMEAILDEAVRTLPQLLDALTRYESLCPRLDTLEAYYSGPLWRQDFEDDSAGKLPASLQRGVLSEDAVFDLLQLQDTIRRKMDSLLNPIPKEENAE